MSTTPPNPPPSDHRDPAASTTKHEWPSPGVTLPPGDGFWVKAVLALWALYFILSLPNWAMGLLLVIALGARYANERLRLTEPQDQQQPSPYSERHDAP